MRTFAVTALVVATLGCSSSPPTPATYEVPVTVKNETAFPAQLLITDDGFALGAPTGFATPSVVPPHETRDVRLVVPGSRPWRLFIHTPDRRTILEMAESRLNGCRVFSRAIQIEFSVDNGFADIPSDEC